MSIVGGASIEAVLKGLVRGERFGARRAVSDLGAEVLEDDGRAVLCEGRGEGGTVTLRRTGCEALIFFF